MAQQNYFDFHFHPVFKQFLTLYESNYPTSRTASDIVRAMDLENDVLDAVDTNFLHILESQCCLDQMNQGGVGLGIANIATIEHGIADSNGHLADLLRSEWTKPVDQRYFTSVRLGEVSYYRLFIRELELYRKLAEATNGSTSRIQILSRRTPVQLDDRALYLALGMEGGHNLSRLKIAKPGSYDIQAPNGTIDAIYDDFCEPPANGVDSLKRLYEALWGKGMDLFHITLTHLTHIVEQPLATHAFGIKILRHPAFHPVGNGISPLGFEIIDAAYTMAADGKQHPILIDIKHMALKSRQDFYAYRHNNPAYQALPIIASHMGVTGYAIHEWIDALSEYALYTDNGTRAVEIITARKKAGEWGSALNDEFTFNPWSINLMDGDIVEILKSGSMIGMSLDVRILGFQAKVGLSAIERSEYVSIENFKTLFPHLRLQDASNKPLESTEVAESWLLPTKEERHPICLCFNFLHAISVGLSNKIEIGKDLESLWKQVCIGSDFDGLIEPVKICRDSSKMPELERLLLKWMPVAEKAYRDENGGPELLPRITDTTALADKPVDNDKLRNIVRGLMYENGKAFLQKWVKGGFDPVVAASPSEHHEALVAVPI